MEILEINYKNEDCLVVTKTRDDAIHICNENDARFIGSSAFFIIGTPDYKDTPNQREVNEIVKKYYEDCEDYEYLNMLKIKLGFLLSNS